MEREPSPMYGASSAVRSSRALPVLQVNVLYGLTGDEVSGSNNTNNNNAAGPLGTATTAGHSAINLSRAATTYNFGPSTASASAVPATTTRRFVADPANPNTGAFSLTAANGTGSATGSSSLAKPVLDPAQVRCCPLDQWVPDAHVVNCMAPDCTNNFSLFNRKHRCRMCGRVFCSSCCNNLVYLSAAAAGTAMPTGLPEGGSGPSSNNNAATASYTNTSTANNSAAATPEPAGVTGSSNGGWANNNNYNTSNSNSNGSGVSGLGGGNGVYRSSGEENSAGSTSPAVLTPTTTAANQGGLMMDGVAVMNNTNNNNVGPAGAVGPSIISSPVTANIVPCRVCASCSYEVQLVVSTRQENGELRRRSRGELKMLQRVLLVNVMTYLNLLDLASVALVSADFYFMSRDNIIWYQYNMTRWVQEGEAMQLSSLKSRAAALRAQQQRATSWYGGGGGSGGAASSLADDIFNSTPVIQDATALSESEAAKRVISLHARYNYTQFLDFARRQEMARCEGLSSFSLGARILLSSPIRVALIGPCGIGKTAAVQAFLGEKPTTMVVRPTIGFQRRAISARLTGGLSTEVTLHLYDLSGADRYEELRRFVCRHCHVIALCYDPSQKVTLVQAADIMMALEPALGPQPVVVCGLLRKGTAAHHSSGANGGRGAEARVGGLPTSRSAGVFDSGAAKKTLALEEHGAQSLPIESDKTAAGSAGPTPISFSATNTSTVTDTKGAASSFSEMGRGGGASSPLSSSVPVLNRSCDSAAAAASGPGSREASSPRGAGTLTVTVPSSASTTAANFSGPSSASSGGPYSSEVSVEDAVGITVRGLSSIQCPMMHPTPLFEAVVQAVLDRLGEATVASTTTISEISAELTSQGEFSPPASVMNRGAGGGGTASRGVPASVMRSSVRRRRPAAASRTIVQDLLNLTMQPCALDILLDRK